MQAQPHDELYAQFRQQIVDSRKSAEDHFEKLLVSLNAGGLTLTVGFVKDIVNLKQAIWLGLLPATWAFFTLALILNLISHRLTVQAADAFTELSSLNNKYPQKFSVINNRIKQANTICAASFVLAVVSFLIFVTINLYAMPKDQNGTQTKPQSPPSEIRGLTFPKPPPPPTTNK